MYFNFWEDCLFTHFIYKKNHKIETSKINLCFICSLKKEINNVEKIDGYYGEEKHTNISLYNKLLILQNHSLSI